MSSVILLPTGPTWHMPLVASFIASVLYWINLCPASHLPWVSIPHVDAVGGHCVWHHNNCSLRQFLCQGLSEAKAKTGKHPESKSWLFIWDFLFYLVVPRFSFVLASPMPFSHWCGAVISQSGCIGRWFFMHSPFCCSSSTSTSTPIWKLSAAR